MKGKAMNYL